MDHGWNVHLAGFINDGAADVAASPQNDVWLKVSQDLPRTLGRL